MTGLLVFGRTGQVARELMKQAPDAHFLGRDEADLTNPIAAADVVRERRPTAIINAAAYTAVDRAETDEETASLVNAAAPAAIANAAAELGVPMLHISTDYVFDGTGDSARDEDAPTGPLGAYGRTKLAGELAIAKAGGQWAILRTSWVFSAHGANFVKTMLRLGSERDEISVVADQIGGPTPAAAIADALLRMSEAIVRDSNRRGIYHFAGAPDVSWADFAREVFGRAGLRCHVRDIGTSEYPTPARRPANSRLDCDLIKRDFGIERPDWRLGLDQVLNDLRMVK
ncbi:dTDP-4-dehydrorhamnose reductase [Paracoccus caeni]|uniref:dTDP-4-dehydrorhamnose reductase n=1 Tax=Paracoccus caeni TaxID=657651 RepID=A0A934SJR2_9RHOB|nr:dTDP-4-dehydrorhamnose reductase [Paracoccus caeni]MBK4216379.1 dTDP-4-dehydrorhamnose reductase [Paracoccus caeni]